LLTLSSDEEPKKSVNVVKQKKRSGKLRKAASATRQRRHDAERRKSIGVLLRIGEANPAFCQRRARNK
jgi:hypothetical protein